MFSAVSIHARTRRATNSLFELAKVLNVSIHARTRRATCLNYLSCAVFYVSIHARTRRATIGLVTIPPLPRFQSTHAHGVRQNHVLIFLAYHRFNPRTHTACDLLGLFVLRGLLKFQSTHAHGVRLSSFSQDSFRILFQSTHAHGVRLKRIFIHTGSSRFNPRTHTACD